VKLLRTVLDKLEPHFNKGGKLERLHPLFEAGDTILYTPGYTTAGPPHVRDLIDLKRMMIFVVLALVPPAIMALYNTGLQVNLVLMADGNTELATAAATTWRGQAMSLMGLTFDPASLVSNMVLGALFFLPVYMVTLAVGGFWEVLFGTVRRHAISEGFLVTSLLFPLILPPTIPLWQVALGASFGVVIGKEVFGGVGMNVLNPALTGRVFLYFAYPGQITGDKIWVGVDSYTAATPLGELANGIREYSTSLSDAFWGFIPGSMGETSVFACFLGAAFLIVTKVGSWRVMVGVLLGVALTSTGLNIVGSDSNVLFGVNAWEHFVLGGFAFGMVYMATDPVSAAHTRPGQWWYGALIGFLTVLVRVINPGFPEGIMLAILFANVFAPAIDKIFVNRHIKRRRLRNVAG
jgi:Na+-transporting NADH:ubiquinone oxidoreductase subunit B